MKILKQKKLMNLKSFFFFLSILITAIFNTATAQLVVTPATDLVSAKDLVDGVLIGEGVTFSNVSWSGQFTYTNLTPTGSQIGRFETGPIKTNLGIEKGIIMSTGDVIRASRPNVYPASSKNYFDYFCACEIIKGDNKCKQNLPGCQIKDADLEALIGTVNKTYDATSLEFDFIPASDQISFRYVFASDEYPIFVCSPTNDVFGFFVTGPKPGSGSYTNENIALIPDKNPPQPVSINTVNSGSCGPGYTQKPGVDLTNNKFYVDNTNHDSIVYNAFTKVFYAKLDVIPCQSYHLKLAIADVVDGVFDSSVFIEAKSFTVKPPKITYEHPEIDDSASVRDCNDAIVTFKTTNGKGVLNDSIINISFTGNAILGTDFSTIPDDISTSITMKKGQDSLVFKIHPLCSGNKIGPDTVNINVRSCGITSTYPIKIIAYPQIAATASPDTTICIGQSVNLSLTNVKYGNGGPYQYSWSSNPVGFTSTASNFTVSPTVTTTYTVRVNDDCGLCSSNIYNIVVTVINLSVNITAERPTTFCSGDSVVLKAKPVKDYTFQWKNSGINIPGPNDSNLIAANAGVYNLVVTGINNCTATSNNITVVISNPVAKITPQGPTSFCKGGSVILDANIIVGYSYHWRKGGVDISDTNTSIKVDSAGIYSFVMSKGAFCKDTSTTLTIIVNPSPIASILPPGPFTVCLDTAITVSANYDPELTYQWQKDGSNIEGATNSIFTFSEKGFYTVIETDNIGCFDKDTVLAAIKCPSLTLFVPNAFTPENSLANTTFYPKGKNIANFNINIYNRWGGLVFHSADMNSGWDGRYKGDLCPLGVYVYVIKYEGYIDNLYQKKSQIGTVTLVR